MARLEYSTDSFAFWTRLRRDQCFQSPACRDHSTRLVRRKPQVHSGRSRTRPYCSSYHGCRRLYATSCRRQLDPTSKLLPCRTGIGCTQWGGLFLLKPRPSFYTRQFGPLCLPDCRRSEEHTSELQSPYDLVCR